MDTIVITGRIPSKKNSKQIICTGRKPRVISSKQHREWHTTAMRQLMQQQAPKKALESCEVVINIYFPDKRRADLTNKAESLMDLLVDYGVLHDDNWQCVGKLELIGWYDKESPRAEIEVTM